MKKFTAIASLLAVITLTACTKNETPASTTIVTPTVEVPAAVAVPVPGPAGPAGEAGQPGQTGQQGAEGEAGKSGDTVIVVPSETK